MVEQRFVKPLAEGSNPSSSALIAEALAKEINVSATKLESRGGL